MKPSLTIAASGVTGLSPAQLLAGAEPKKPLKVTRRSSRYDRLDVDDDVLAGQIASEERDILRFVEDRIHWGAEPELYVEQQLPNGRVHRTPVKTVPPAFDYSTLDYLRRQAIAQGIPASVIKYDLL